MLLCSQLELLQVVSLKEEIRLLKAEKSKTTDTQPAHLQAPAHLRTPDKKTWSESDDTMRKSIEEETNVRHEAIAAEFGH